MYICAPVHPFRMVRKKPTLLLMVIVTVLVVRVFLLNRRGRSGAIRIPNDIDLPSLSDVRHEVTNGFLNGKNTASLTLQHTSPRVECLSLDLDDHETKIWLPEATNTYFHLAGGRLCFIPGTDVDKNAKQNTSSCVCAAGWGGEMCNYPIAVTVALNGLPPSYKASIRTRRRARRVIHAFPFHMEFDMLEARLAELAGVVDVFLILESNYTAYGTPKRLYLRERLQQGYYKDLSCRLVYVFLDYFPAEAKKDGWIADALHRNYMGEERGLLRIANPRPDDLILVTDADELPSREAVLFLKCHDGFPEPAGFAYRWTVFGFFWRHRDVITHNVCGAVTYGMSRAVLRHRLYKLRGVRKIFTEMGAINAYLKSGGKVLPNKCWYLGSPAVPSGFHCSWCFDSEGIREKLISAQNGDFPRWGDQERKQRIAYIDHLVKTGTWFDDKTKFVSAAGDAPGNAPRHILDNRVSYKSIVWNPQLNRKTTVNVTLHHPGPFHSIRPHSVGPT